MRSRGLGRTDWAPTGRRCHSRRSPNSRRCRSRGIRRKRQRRYRKRRCWQPCRHPHPTNRIPGNLRRWVRLQPTRNHPSSGLLGIDCCRRRWNYPWRRQTMGCRLLREPGCTSARRLSCFHHCLGPSWLRCHWRFFPHKPRKAAQNSTRELFRVFAWAAPFRRCGARSTAESTQGR